MEIHNLGSSYRGASKVLNTYIFFILVIPFAASISLDKLTFNFTGFDANKGDIVFEGDATISSQVLQLTTNQVDKELGGSSGRARYKAAMHLWDKASGNLANFTTHFTFFIDPRYAGSFGDGFTFFLVPNGSLLPGNSTGGNLGLVDNQPSSNTTAQFVALEVDTYQNTWDPSLGKHIGIDINSVTSVKTNSWNWEYKYAWISYDSSSKNLSFLVSDQKNASQIGANMSSVSSFVDLRTVLPEWVNFGFSASTGSSYEIHSIESWDFSSSLKISEDPTHGRNSTTNGSSKSNTRFWVIPVVAGSCILILGLIWFLCWRKKSTRESEEDPKIENGKVSADPVPPPADPVQLPASPVQRDGDGDTLVAGPREFSYKELLAATENFSNERILGNGGSGEVYQGVLDESTKIAVKKIRPNSGQGKKEYESEVKAINTLRHKNLVRLMGWCHEKEYLIVYEFMENKSLDFHLFNRKSGGRLLTWEDRHKIALGLASALQYMQEESSPYVLHRDIKPNNVLLDSEFNAKLGDFGLARLIYEGQDPKTTKLFGTDGYMAPEYLASGRATKASDVYGFGIVALEIASGWEVTEQREENIDLVTWVRKHCEKGNVSAIADSRLEKNYDREKMERLIFVGLWCAHPDSDKRPSISQAIHALKCYASECSVSSAHDAFGGSQFSTPSSTGDASRATPFSETSPASA